MNLYFDLDAGIFVSGPGTRDRVDRLSFKRGDTVSLAVRFLRGIVVQELASGATGQIGLKELGEYDADLVAGATSWTKTGTTTSTVYTFELGLNTAELNALLAHDATEGNDVASVDLMFEMEVIAGGITTSSPTLTCTIQNDVIKNDELVPAPSAGQAPLILADPPVSAADAVPITLTITGITDPVSSDPVVVSIAEIIEGKFSWGDNAVWQVRYNGTANTWEVSKNDGIDYLASVSSTAKSPVGLTFDEVSAGGGLPSVAGSVVTNVNSALPGRIAIADESDIYIATDVDTWTGPLAITP